MSKASDPNLSIMIGRITRDAELTYTNSGTALSKFSIAVNKVYDGKEEVNYFEMTLWAKVAESLNQYLTKGKQVYLESEAKQSRWDDSDGKKRSKITFNVRKVKFLGSKGESSGFNDIP
jgi:single-strand DNA-binding protein